MRCCILLLVLPYLSHQSYFKKLFADAGVAIHCPSDNKVYIHPISGDLQQCSQQLGNYNESSCPEGTVCERFPILIPGFQDYCCWADGQTTDTENLIIGTTTEVPDELMPFTEPPSVLPMRKLVVTAAPERPDDEENGNEDEDYEEPTTRRPRNRKTTTTTTTEEPSTTTKKPSNRRLPRCQNENDMPLIDFGNRLRDCYYQQCNRGYRCEFNKEIYRFICCGQANLIVPPAGLPIIPNPKPLIPRRPRPFGILNDGDEEEEGCPPKQSVSGCKGNGRQEKINPSTMNPNVNGNGNGYHQGYQGNGQGNGNMNSGNNGNNNGNPNSYPINNGNNNNGNYNNYNGNNNNNSNNNQGNHNSNNQGGAGGGGDGYSNQGNYNNNNNNGNGSGNNKNNNNGNNNNSENNNNNNYNNNNNQNNWNENGCPYTQTRPPTNNGCPYGPTTRPSTNDGCSGHYNQMQGCGLKGGWNQNGNNENNVEQQQLPPPRALPEPQPIHPGGNGNSGTNQPQENRIGNGNGQGNSNWGDYDNPYESNKGSNGGHSRGNGGYENGPQRPQGGSGSSAGWPSPPSEGRWSNNRKGAGNWVESSSSSNWQGPNTRPNDQSNWNGGPSPQGSSNHENQKGNRWNGPSPSNQGSGNEQNGWNEGPQQSKNNWNGGKGNNWENQGDWGNQMPGGYGSNVKTKRPSGNANQGSSTNGPATMGSNKGGSRNGMDYDDYGDGMQQTKNRGNGGSMSTGRPFSSWNGGGTGSNKRRASNSQLCPAGSEFRESGVAPKCFPPGSDSCPLSHPRCVLSASFDHDVCCL